MMMLKMAFRNIFRHKRRTLFTGLNMFGGFVMAAVFIGFADGTYNHIIDGFTRNHYGHIQIHAENYLDRPSLYKTIDDPAVVKEALSGLEHMDSWAPRVYSSGLGSLGEKSSGIQITGVDPVREEETTHFSRKIIQGEGLSPQPEKKALLGKGLAEVLNAERGSEVVVISQGADGSIANDLYQVAGMLDLGDEASNRTAFYMHIQDAQELFVLGKRIHEIAVTVDDLGRVRPANRLLEKRLEGTGLDPAPWQEFARSFYVAMKADMQGMWIMMVVIILVVAIGVLNTVLMSVLERRREYGVLKAVGTKPHQIVKLVLAEVNILAVFSIIFGVGIGLLVNWILSQYGFSLSQPISWGGMDIQSMKAEINIRSFVIPAVTVLLSAVTVSIVPALKAARTEPARIMRMH
ncbi:MAG: ABC transporter permease [Candidatus Aminicenantaceae bacterium]